LEHRAATLEVLKCIDIRETHVAKLKDLASNMAELRKRYNAISYTLRVLISIAGQLHHKGITTVPVAVTVVINIVCRALDASEIGAEVGKALTALRWTTVETVEAMLAWRVCKQYHIYIDYCR